MTDTGNKIDGLEIAYIGGGSRGWAWTLMTDLAMEPTLGGCVRLYDTDEAAADVNAVIGNAITARDDAPGKWHYEVARTLKDAVTGADFVIISILPGTFDEMAVDVHLPERLGIYQSVGDTAGIGGLSRALRTVPMFVTIAEAIRDYAPHAWVINYTNPLALCVRTLYAVYPEIKAFGCCHEVFSTQKLLADIATLELGRGQVQRADIQTDVVGVNHFTWFTRASWRNQDLFPMYRKFIEEHFEEGFNDPDKNWMNSTFNCAHRVKFDLFRRFGAIAAAGDRHLAEFMPGDTYLKDPETVRSWKFSLTPVSWRKEDLKRRLERASRLYSGEEQMKLVPTGEEGVQMIRAICGLGRIVTNVNLPNFAGQIPGIDRDTVLETNAVFSHDEVTPVYAGALPESLQPLMAPHIANQRDILKASLTGDFDLALEAMLRDPQAVGRITREEGAALLRDLIAGTAAYLPDHGSRFFQK